MSKRNLFSQRYLLFKSVCFKPFRISSSECPVLSVYRIQPLETLVITVSSGFFCSRARWRTSALSAVSLIKTSTRPVRSHTGFTSWTLPRIESRYREIPEPLFLHTRTAATSLLFRFIETITIRLRPRDFLFVSCVSCRNLQYGYLPVINHSICRPSNTQSLFQSWHRFRSCMD